MWNMRLVTYFNSTMVRLKEDLKHEYKEILTISIPLWYD